MPSGTAKDLSVPQWQKHRWFLSISGRYLSSHSFFSCRAYELSDRYADKISYERNTPEGIDAIDFPINQGKYPTFACFHNNKYSYVFIRELKAINQQCKELWGDDVL